MNRRIENLNRKGRKPGSRSKTPARIVIAEAFEEIGGMMALAAWARENQTEFYKLYAKLIPAHHEITGADGGPIETKYAGYSDAELDQMILEKLREIGIAAQEPG